MMLPPGNWRPFSWGVPEEPKKESPKNKICSCGSEILYEGFNSVECSNPQCKWYKAPPPPPIVAEAAGDNQDKINNDAEDDNSDDMMQGDLFGTNDI